MIITEIKVSKIDKMISGGLHWTGSGSTARTTV